MSIHVPPAGPQGPAGTPAVQPRPRTAAPVEPAPRPTEAVSGVTVDAVPSRPPIEVLREMEAASRRWDELRAQQRQLHFSHDPDSNRVVIEVTDMEGNVLRTIPPSKALDVIAGGPLD